LSQLRLVLIERGVVVGGQEPLIVEDPDEIVDQPPARRGRLARRIALGLGVALLLLIALLAVTAPLSKSLQPITAPSITLLSAEGKPIARRGSVTDLPVEAAALPRHVPGAFLAIEDRRFYEHLGLDPWGLLRAAGRNIVAGGVVEGGSTISQQLAKLAFLSSDQTLGRKLQEAVLALWLEAWLSKDEILSRYMSSVYFGDNVYGLRAAASHYFSRRPEELTVEQAAMLAGLIKAPSTLAPTSNLEGARERGRVVAAAMAKAGYIDEATARELPVVKLKRGAAKDIPSGTYFADWVLSELGRSEPRYGEQRIQTTLEDRLQRQAAAAIRSVGTGGAQVALVAMRPDGRVVAMVGGRSYKQSPFNRVTQAKRQSGSTFKLFVYLAALRSGFTPNNLIEDRPVRIGKWTPENYEGKYRGVITLRDAFAFSSNVAAVRLSQQVGIPRVIQAARDLGVTSELEQGPTVALGTSGISLMEMTSAFASLAHGTYPVKPRGLPESTDGTLAGTPFEGSTRRMMLELLGAVTRQGTGRAAALPIASFGKTGTTQGNRDAYFIGFAGDLVTGVWIGRDDNQPVGDIQGGGAPARIWRAFMAEAVKDQPAGMTDAQIAAPTEEVMPATGPVTSETYDIGDYDVEEATAPLGTEGGEGTSVPPPPAGELPPEAPAPGDEAPPQPAGLPAVTPPPPPPAPEEEAPPEEEE
jgi:penicillin-binding protein 1A